MKESLSLRFLYRTVCGRAILKVLLRPGISKAAGAFLSCPLSKVFIKSFAKSNNITLENIAVPEKGFASFNDFFARKRIEINFDANPDCLCSPCDGYLSCYNISADSRFEIKRSSYSVAQLLQDEALAKEYENGVALIFRLTPANYHRYSFAEGGTITAAKSIKGILHCVRPIAMEKYPVFIQNSRCYVCEETESFGKLVQMEIGALFVGKIYNHPVSSAVERGQEKGYFMFGGSTIVLLVKDSVLALSNNGLPCKTDGVERPVVLGQCVAKRK